MQRLASAAVAAAASFVLLACTDRSDSLAPPALSPAATADATAAATAATPISGGGEGWEAAADVDSAGNSVAVWVERTTNPFLTDHVWSKGRPAGGMWGQQSVLSKALQTTYVYPAVQVTDDGFATAVWSDANGVFTADRARNGTWSPAIQLVSGATNPIFVMNRRGDAAVLWGSGSVRGGPTQLNVVRRSTGGAWGAPEIIATGTHVQYDDASIAEGTGDVVASWESYTAVCARHCAYSNFVLHVSRAAVGGAWQDSGPLTAPATTDHDAQVTIDPPGHAAAVYATSRSVYVSVVQAGAGAPWSAPANVFAVANAIVSALETTSRGEATLAFLDVSGASQVKTVSGDIVANTWGNAVLVSGSDQSPGQVIFAMNGNGTAVLTWAAGNPNLTTNMIRVATRRGATGAWLAPRTISPAGAQLASPESAALNAAGKGIVIFSAFNGALTTHTEYATTN